MSIENAKIIRTELTMSEHGCLTFWLIVEGSGWGIGVGGFCIGYGYLGAENFKAENGYGLEAMMHIMDVVGVDTWEKLKGQLIRCETTGWGGQVTKIGNIMKDKWFDLKAFFEEKQKGAEK